MAIQFVCRVRYSGGQIPNAYFALYIVPVRPGLSRTFFGFGVPTGKLLAGGRAVGGLLRRLPHWAMDLHALADQDVIMLHTQVGNCII